MDILTESPDDIDQILDSVEEFSGRSVYDVVEYLVTAIAVACARDDIDGSEILAEAIMALNEVDLT